MFHFSDARDIVAIRANREQTYIDGRAFVKAKIVFRVGYPVLFARLTQTFEIEEILSDTEACMFWSVLVWICIINSNICYSFSNNLNLRTKICKSFHNPYYFGGDGGWIERVLCNNIHFSVCN